MEQKPMKEDVRPRAPLPLCDRCRISEGIRWFDARWLCAPCIELEDAELEEEGRL
jgi:hypothetical protein